MDANQKGNAVFWLVIFISIFLFVEKGLDAYAWFNRRFVESGNSRSYQGK